MKANDPTTAALPTEAATLLLCVYRRRAWGPFHKKRVRALVVMQQEKKAVPWSPMSRALQRRSAGRCSFAARAALACVLPAAGDSVDGECVGHEQSCELCAVLNTRGVYDPVALICAVSPFLSLGQATST